MPTPLSVEYLPIGAEWIASAEMSRGLLTAIGETMRDAKIALDQLLVVARARHQEQARSLTQVSLAAKSVRGIDYENPSGRVRTAYHESGHALVTTQCSAHPRVERVSLGDAGGRSCNNEALGLTPMADWDRTFPVLVCHGIAGLIAGRMAEEIAFGSVSRDLDYTDKRRDEATVINLAIMLEKHYAERTPRRDHRALQRMVSEKFLEAAALAEYYLRTQWGAVESIAKALLECGSIPGDLVRLLITNAPQKSKPLPTLDEDIALMERAERAEPRMRGACAELRRRLAEQNLEQMRMVLHALQTLDPPKPVDLRRPFAVGRA